MGNAGGRLLGQGANTAWWRMEQVRRLDRPEVRQFQTVLRAFGMQEEDQIGVGVRPGFGQTGPR